MAYSDRLIIESVRELQGRPDLTVTDIAIHAHVPFGTAKRALKRLETTGQIERDGKGRRWGSVYRVKGETA